MKRLYKSFIITVVTIVLALSSCSDFLQPGIYDKLTPDNFPMTAKDAESLVSSVYYQFRDGEWSRYNSDNESRLVLGLLGTDEFTCHWQGYWGSPFNFTWSPDEFPFSKMYYDMVPAVTIATSAIVQLKKIGDKIDNELLERYISEIKVARAYFMYDLYNLYGPVPVITDEKDIADIENLGYRPRPTNAAMVKLIEDDLTDEIISKLEVKYPDSEYGRFTQGAARMCLLKLYLHEKDYPKVEEQARRIKALGYDLEEKYEDIWSIDNERNNEIIWALVCKPSPEGIANNFRAHVLPADWKSPLGYPSEGWNGYKVPWTFYDRFDPADRRRELLVRYYTNMHGHTVDARELYYGAIPLKYSEDPAGTGVNQGVDYVVYRYADVLLALAEAINENVGPTQEAIDLINDIRGRAFGEDESKMLKLDGMTQEKLREAILDERGFELYFEGNRREDLIRFGKYIEYANTPERMGYIEDAGDASRPINPQKNAKAHHVLYPIPNKLIVESGGVLKQNTGYDY